MSITGVDQPLCTSMSPISCMSTKRSVWTSPSTSAKASRNSFSVSGEQREQHQPVRARHAVPLGKYQMRFRVPVQGQIGPKHVKAVGGERQRGKIALHQFEQRALAQHAPDPARPALGVALAGLAQHGRRHIEARDLRIRILRAGRTRHGRSRYRAPGRASAGSVACAPACAGRSRRRGNRAGRRQRCACRRRGGSAAWTAGRHREKQRHAGTRTNRAADGRRQGTARTRRRQGAGRGAGGQAQVYARCAGRTGGRAAGRARPSAGRRGRPAWMPCCRAPAPCAGRSSGRSSAPAARRTCCPWCRAVPCAACLPAGPPAALPCAGCPPGAPSFDAALTLGDYAPPQDSRCWHSSSAASCRWPAGSPRSSPGGWSAQGFQRRHCWRPCRWRRAVSPRAASTKPGNRRAAGTAARRPADPVLLRRRRETSAQSALDLAARGLHNAGCVRLVRAGTAGRPACRHGGRCDDIGATLAAARTLKAHGAARVTVLVALRTP